MSLLNASKNGDLCKVQKLLNKGADIHIKNDKALRLSAHSMGI